MRRDWLVVRVMLVLGIAGVAAAQPRPLGSGDPWAGQWRGALALPNGERAGVLLAIAGEKGAYSGYVSGFEEGATVPLAIVSVEGPQLVAEATAESDFGVIAVRYELTQDEQALTGMQRYVLGLQTVESPIELKRAFRLEVPQPQVEQRLTYFLGDWELEYAGAEFPPLSLGVRSGRVRFTRTGDAPFLRGAVTEDLYGEAYEESVIIGYDEATDVLLFKETLSNGTELLSLGNWQSPIAINLMTNPVEAGGQVHQAAGLLLGREDRGPAGVATGVHGVLRLLAREPVQPGSGSERRLGRAALGRDDDRVHDLQRRPVGVSRARVVVAHQRHRGKLSGPMAGDAMLEEDRCDVPGERRIFRGGPRRPEPQLQHGGYRNDGLSVHAFTSRHTARPPDRGSPSRPTADRSWVDVHRRCFAEPQHLRAPPRPRRPGS